MQIRGQNSGSRTTKQNPWSDHSEQP